MSAQIKRNKIRKARSARDVTLERTDKEFNQLTHLREPLLDPSMIKHVYQLVGILHNRDLEGKTRRTKHESAFERNKARGRRSRRRAYIQMRSIPLVDASRDGKRVFRELRSRAKERTRGKKGKPAEEERVRRSPVVRVLRKRERGKEGRETKDESSSDEKGRLEESRTHVDSHSPQAVC